MPGRGRRGSGSGGLWLLWAYLDLTGVYLLMVMGNSFSMFSSLYVTRTVMLRLRVAVEKRAGMLSVRLTTELACRLPSHFLVAPGHCMRTDRFSNFAFEVFFIFISA